MKKEEPKKREQLTEKEMVVLHYYVTYLGKRHKQSITDKLVDDVIDDIAEKDASEGPGRFNIFDNYFSKFIKGCDEPKNPPVTLRGIYLDVERHWMQFDLFADIWGVEPFTFEDFQTYFLLSISFYLTEIKSEWRAIQETDGDPFPEVDLYRGFVEGLVDMQAVKMEWPEVLYVDLIKEKAGPSFEVTYSSNLVKRDIRPIFMTDKKLDKRPVLLDPFLVSNVCKEVYPRFFNKIKKYSKEV